MLKLHGALIFGSRIQLLAMLVHPLSRMEVEGGCPFIKRVLWGGTPFQAVKTKTFVIAGVGLVLVFCILRIQELHGETD